MNQYCQFIKLRSFKKGVAKAKLADYPKLILINDLPNWWTHEADKLIYLFIAFRYIGDGF